DAHFECVPGVQRTQDTTLPHHSHSRHQNRRVGRSRARPARPERTRGVPLTGRNRAPVKLKTTARFVEALKLDRSSRYLYWAAFITFISEPHDEVPDLILAPYRSVSLAGRGCDLLFPLMRDAIDVNRSGYVFQINLANIFGGQLQFTGDLFLHLPGDA